MKLFRSIALILCAVLITSFIYQAKGEGDAVAYAMAQNTLECCAAELSACTGYPYYKNENTDRYINYRLIHMDYTLDAVISYVNIGLDRYFYSNPEVIASPGSTDVLVNKYRPLPSSYIPQNLEKISSKYSYGTQKMTHTARRAFEKMCADAKKHGYGILASSSYRSYDKQAEVYASFFTQADPASVAVQELICARPGYSEHQTGLAVDAVRATPSQNNTVYKWLFKNACKYGFIVRYPIGKEGVTGYANEPWHLRYLGVELATAVYNSGLTYDEYYIREIDISDKSGDVPVVGVTAHSQISIDGTSYQLSAVWLSGNTYYKLRDIAVILNNTSKAFDIVWDGEAKRIDMRLGVPYSAALTLSASDTGHAVLASASQSGLQALGCAVDLKAYSIGGATYFKLQDIMNLLGLTAADDGAGNLIIKTVSIAAAPLPDTSVPPG